MSNTSTTTNVTLTRPPTTLGAKERAWEARPTTAALEAYSRFELRVCFFLSLLYTLLTVIYRLERMATTTALKYHNDNRRFETHLRFELLVRFFIYPLFLLTAVMQE
jgi:hypothetical protein